MTGKSPKAARRFRQAVDQAATLIGEQPFAGTERIELASPPFRFWPLTGFNYVFVYSTGRRPPEIYRILHGARDLPERLGEFRDD